MQDEKLVYLESDEEITSVIDKISKASSPEVALVIPRGGNLGQSIVNLKLLKKRSTDLGKDVSLVTTDKISRNLASQVGITVYSRVEEVGRRKPEPVAVVAPVIINKPETIKSEVPAPEAKKPAEELPEIPGVKINRYYDQRPSQPEAQSLESKVESPSGQSLRAEPKSREEQKPEVNIQELQPTSRESGPTPEVIEQIQPPADDLPNIDNASPHEAPPVETVSARRVILNADLNEIPKSEFKNRKIEDVALPPELVETASEVVESPHPKKKDSASSEPHEPKKMKAGRRFQPMKKRRALTILIASALIIILAFGYLILPQAKATVTFKADSFTETAEVQLNTAATKIDPVKLIFPATASSVEKSVSDTFQATGKKNIGNKAAGEITFYNYIDLTPDKISSGSTLTANGKNFVTVGDITIPAVTVTSVIPFASTPGSIKGQIAATDSGEGSNLPSGTKYTFTAFSGNKQNNVYGQSTAALTGGSTQEVQIVQASDISAAQDKIKARLSSEAKDEVMKKIPSTDKYIDGTFDEQISSLVASVPEGTQAPNFTFKGNVKTSILSFNETNLRGTIVANYEAKLPQNRVMVQADKITFDYALENKNITGGTAQYKVTYKGKISSKIDQNTLKDQLRGKSFDDAKKILSSLDLVKDVSISMTPNLSFYKTLPLLSRSITIDTVYQVE
jgi:hypothetical protein